MEKSNRCEIKVERNLFGQVEKVIAKDCSDKQVEATLKRRNINIGEINLIKKD